MCSPRHPHVMSFGSYVGLQYSFFLAGEGSTDYLPWKDVAIFVFCSLPFTYQQTHESGAEGKTTSKQLRIATHLSAVTHQLRLAGSVSFTLSIWSHSHVTSTTPPSLTSGHLLK